MKIFVASTGRCGTQYLSELFRILTQCPARHEPRPYVISEVLEEINTTGPISDRAKTILSQKIKQIKKDTNSDGWYMESNQQFIKAYVDSVFEAFPAEDIGCVYVERPPVDMLISYYEKCKRFELDWFLRSHWQKNIMKTEKVLSFLENALWQFYEIRERYIKHKSRFGKTFEMDFKSLTDIEVIKKMFGHFGVPAREFFELPPLANHNALVAMRKRPYEAIVSDMRRDWDIPGRYVYAWDLREIALKGGVDE